MPRTTRPTRGRLASIVLAAGVGATALSACGSTTGPAGANADATATAVDQNPQANLPPSGSAPSDSAAAGPSTAAPSAAATSDAIAPSTPANTPAVANATDLTKQPIAAKGTGTPSTSLVIKDLVVGTGTPAVATDSVNVKYAGTIYATGKSFDASWTDGATNQVANFPLNMVVPGFAEGIVGMKPGGRREIVIPPALGYGSAGQSQAGISGTDTLVFVVDYLGAGTS